MFVWIADPNAWLALGTLTVLEIVLSVDNIVFLSLIVDKLPKNQQSYVRHFGLIGAMLMRLILLASISWMIRLTHPLFVILDHTFSARNLILLGGGLFLLWKSSMEIHDSIEEKNKESIIQAHSFIGAVVQVIVLDIIFSLDSVITAVGLSDHLFIMIAAVIISVSIMMFAAKCIGEFVNRHPSVKMLALSFLILTGFTLVLEGLGIHIPKGYIYFSMFFSMSVECLNLIRRKKGV